MKSNVKEFVRVSPEKEATNFLNKKKGTRIISEVVNLTPALASVLLERNQSNRSIRQARVKAFANDMIKGRWHLNGEPIIIADNGLMNDGQHRCQAVIESGITIPVLIVFNVKRDTRTSLDQGTNRSLGDYLDMENVPQGKLVGSVARYAWDYTKHGYLRVKSDKQASKDELLEFALEHKEFIDMIRFIDRKGVARQFGLSFLAFSYWLFWRKDQQAARDFIDKFITGEGLFLNNPILYTRNRLLSQRNLRIEVKVELMIKTWNAWRRNETPRTLPISGKLPDIEK